MSHLAKNSAVVMLVAFVGMMLTPAPAPGQGGNRNPGVIPPDARYRGLSYGEWQAKWWQAAFALPVVDGYHPLLSGGAFGGEDGVVFLTGVGGNPTIEVTIPDGTALFFPIINYECSIFEAPPFHGDDEASLRAAANQLMDGVTELAAEIDGRPVNDLTAYRNDSPLFEWGPLPENNIFTFIGEDAPAGTTSESVDAGAYLLLAPLNVGAHTIHFRETNTGDIVPGTIETTYIIHVVPRR
jgi:hypothetical protein